MDGAVIRHVSRALQIRITLQDGEKGLNHDTVGHTEDVRTSNRSQEIFNTCSDTGRRFAAGRGKALRFRVPSIPLIGPTIGDVAFGPALPESVMDFRKTWVSINVDICGNDLSCLKSSAQWA